MPTSMGSMWLMPGANAVAVAEHAIALMLAIGRSIHKLM